MFRDGWLVGMLRFVFRCIHFSTMQKQQLLLVFAHSSETYGLLMSKKSHRWETWDYFILLYFFILPSFSFLCILLFHIFPFPHLSTFATSLLLLIKSFPPLFYSFFSSLSSPRLRFSIYVPLFHWLLLFPT